VEALEGNKVKVTVQISEAEFEKDLDVAFKRLAKEVRLPGFRAGKAPRKVLEARIGSEYARGDAFENSLPRYYSEAVRDHEVDVIAPPDIDITDGETEGAVTFDAVVEVRPQVSIAGYDSLEVEVEAPDVDEAELDEAQERFLKAHGELVDADRPAENGDTIIMNIKAEVGDEAVPGLTADDYSYTLGSGSIVPELDDELVAAEPDDEFDFAANHPDPDEEESLRFSIKINKVQRVELPEPTEEFMQQNSEFDTIEEYRADYVERTTASRIERAAADRRNAVAQSAGELVSEDSITAPLIDLEVENRIEDMAMRMQQQGMQLEQFIQMTGQTNEQFVEGVRATAGDGAKIDLALRAVAVAEGLECTDEELTDEVETASEALSQPADEIRKRYAEAGMLPNIRADISKRKALDFLVEKATVKDSDGNVIAPERFELPESEDAESDTDSSDAAEDTEDSND
jgi:trigger factor